jgi:DNA-directed RNA polymerase subunit M/transcription elongation factor TFIIS
LTQGGGVQLHVTTFISVDLYVSAPPEYGAGKILTAQIITQSNYWARLVCPDSVYSLYKKKKKKHKDVKTPKHKNTTSWNKNTTETQTKWEKKVPQPRCTQENMSMANRQPQKNAPLLK